MTIEPTLDKPVGLFNLARELMHQPGWVAGTRRTGEPVRTAISRRQAISPAGICPARESKAPPVYR